MFEGMRRHAPWIVIGIATVFILSMAIGGISSIFTKKEYVGIIDGKEITPTEYREIYENALSNHVQQNPDEKVDDAKLKQINDQTWNQLVQQILFDKDIKKRKLKVTNNDIVEKLRDPFDDIKEIEQFQTDGKFDYDKYEALLLENTEFATWVESRIKATLPYEQLYDDVKSEITVTEEEVRQQYYDDNNKAEAKIIFFDPKKENFEVTDEDMEKYYEENKEEYKKGPGRKLKYVKLALAASEEDKQLAKVKADSIYQVVIDGMDFAEAAIELSEGPSASKGGDLGFFTRERMVKEFSDAAFLMGINDISEPVLSQFGWHIIKVVAKQKNKEGAEEVKASHILVKADPSEKTKANMEVIANDFFIQAKKSGIDSAAVIMAYKVDESKEFYEDATYISGIGSNEDLVDFAFSKKVGALFKPFTIRNDDYIVAELSYVVGDHYLTLESEINTIRRKTKDELALKQIVKKAEEFTTKYVSSKYLEAAKDEDWKIIDAKDISLNRTIPGLKKDEELNKTILEFNEGENSDLITNENGAYIAFITKKELPDMEVFEKEKESLIVKAKDEAQNEHLNEWFGNLKDNAKIVDNRNKYYSF